MNRPGNGGGRTRSLRRARYRRNPHPHWSSAPALLQQRVRPRNPEQRLGRPVSRLRPGVGVCLDAQTGLTAGAFAQAGAFAGTSFAAISFPDQNGRPAVGGASGNGAFGRYAGGGLGLFVSNARRIGDLRDAFTTYALDTAAGSVSLAQSGDVWVFTAQPPQTSRGTGAAITRLQTYTWILADLQLSGTQGK